MAKHKFLIGVTNEKDVVVGTQCVRCSQIFLYDKDGKLPDDIRNEDCELEDVNQAAARIVREATERD